MVARLSQLVGISAGRAAGGASQQPHNQGPQEESGSQATCSLPSCHKGEIGPGRGCALGTRGQTAKSKGQGTDNKCGRVSGVRHRGATSGSCDLPDPAPPGTPMALPPHPCMLSALKTLQTCTLGSWVSQEPMAGHQPVGLPFAPSLCSDQCLCVTSHAHQGHHQTECFSPSRLLSH